MIRILRHYRWVVPTAGLFLGAVVVPVLSFSWPAPVPGSAEDEFARLQVGMTQNRRWQSCVPTSGAKGITRKAQRGMANRSIAIIRNGPRSQTWRRRIPSNTVF